VKLVFFATTSAAAALVVGCGGFADEELQDGCAGEPVTEEVLVGTLGRRGFELVREGDCEPGQVPVATFTNITEVMWETDEGDVIWGSDGWVTCFLHSDPRFGDEVERRRSDEWVVMNVRNVACYIDASDPWQIEQLQLAVGQLARVAP
jgi:hypothetical protein